MNRIDDRQMKALQAAQRAHFRRELCRLVEARFGPASGDDQRSAQDVVATAVDFAASVGASSDAQLTRVAVILAAVNRQRLAQDKVAQLREILLRPAERPVDERLADASIFLGLDD